MMETREILVQLQMVVRNRDESREMNVNDNRNSKVTLRIRSRSNEDRLNGLGRCRRVKERVMEPGLGRERTQNS